MTTFPPVFSFTRFANSVAETSKSEPGEPTWPNFSSVACARAGATSIPSINAAESRNTLMDCLRRKTLCAARMQVDRPWHVEVKPLRRGGVSETSLAVLTRSAILHAHDEAQAGPDVVDRAHLVVDEALAETDLADDVLVEVGGHAGSSLWPCDPKATGRIERRAQPAELLRQPGPRSEESHDHVGRAARPRNHAERVRKPFGRGKEAHAGMLPDAKLPRQGRSRVAGHRSYVPGNACRSLDRGYGDRSGAEWHAGGIRRSCGRRHRFRRFRHRIGGATGHRPSAGRA